MSRASRRKKKLADRRNCRRLGAIAMLVLMTGMGTLARTSALALGTGAIIYPAFWLMAGFMAPGLGSTGAAKDALEFVAIPGAGLALLGTLGCLIALVCDRPPVPVVNQEFGFRR